MSCPLDSINGLPPHTKDDARAIFRKACRDGAVVSTKHSRKRMHEYQIDNNDILNFARIGIVRNAPEIDIKTNEWCYRIESDAHRVKVVFTILGSRRVRLITVITD
jgi:hypothetical protein